MNNAPRTWLRAYLARQLFLRVTRRMKPSLAGLRLRRPGDFFRRVGADGLIGFGESYTAGDWEADDLVGVLTAFAAEVDRLVPPGLQRLRRLALPRVPASDLGTRKGARRNVPRHYDLSNDLFAAFLDRSMTYSAAQFPDPRTATWADLATAQHRKIDRLLTQARVGPGTRLLEIGSGWGELAIRAARRGAEVVSITLSKEQAELARERAQRAGASGKAEFRLCDYREVEGDYDAIVSVEMIEAVGAPYWREYFAVLNRRLAPGGRIALQTITMPHERMLATLGTHTWVQKHIFPGGMLPSLSAIEGLLGPLRIVDRLSLREHYARTLLLWRERYAQQREAISGLGFDETFHRMWTLYLAYSEAGFRAGYLDVWQLTMERGRR
ncbi:cyclopropane-fatty-acyl-phospholipid synthase family protein [Nonomuraea sp. NPDC050643]|uniref:cyclopropane-fatty-acyl-phospholipid synthase family protein n=1 Tax=Nonomuraea sp. NPDC050643 TaxID=3155660 RepID=UPI0033DC3EBB